MPRLPSPIGGSVQALVEQLRQWKAILDGQLSTDGEPLLEPRNVRCEKPTANTIRVRWDPGSINTEGHDISYSESADFAHSQSHRVQGREARYFDLVVGNTDKRYFRIRSFKGAKVSRWSNIAPGLADVATPSGGGTVSGDPGTVNFTPTLGPYGMMGFKGFTLTGKADLLHVVVWYVDEPSIQYLYGVLAGALDATTTPVTVSVNIFARQVEGVFPTFATGDLVVIDDPDQDPVNTTFRKYEIATLGTIGGGTVTLTSRGGVGSYKSAHNSGRHFYKVKLAHFTIPTKDNAGNDKIFNEEFFPLSSACVVGMAVAASDVGFIGTYNLKNCSQLGYPYPGNLIQRNPAPGFRTCTGAEYTLPLLGGALPGQTMPVRILVAENASIRDVVGILTVAPVESTATYNGVLGNLADVALVAYVLYVEPLQYNQSNAGRRVAVLEQLAIKSGEFASFPSSDLPDFRRMPYTLAWPFELPVVGTLGSLFDPDVGSLLDSVLPFSTTGESIWFEEGGELDAVIALSGWTVPGSNLTLSVMT